MLAHQPHPPQPGPPAGGGGIGAQGRLDFRFVELVEFEAEEQGVGRDGRGLGAHVAFELGPGRVLPAGRRHQARIGADRPKLVGRFLIKARRVGQEGAQALRIGPGDEELALELGQGRIGGARGGKVLFDARVLAAVIEVGQVPFGQFGLGGGGVNRHGGHIAPPLRSRVVKTDRMAATAPCCNLSSISPQPDLYSPRRITVPK